MTGQSSGGGTSLPGVTSDGANGVIIAGDIHASGGALSTDINTNSANFAGYFYIGSFDPTHFFPFEIDPDGTLRVGYNDGSWASLAPSGQVTGNRQGVSGTAFLSSGVAVGGGFHFIGADTLGDVTFSVSGAGDLRFHGKFQTGAAVTHTLGAYSGKSVEVFDEAGVSLGFMPLYA